MNDTTNKLSPNEHIKRNSRGLRGSISEGLHDQLTGALSPDDQQLIKFHGTYQQDDRDRRAERERKKLEPAYSYMIRLRIPGGDISAQQWLELQDIANTHANGIIKITTRQTVQFHGIVKSHMKPTMQWFDALGLDSIAACGDVNRNVMAGANPAITPFHQEVFAFADSISAHLLPTTQALTEVWLDGEKLQDKEAEPDPLYQDRYLPRKFKIGIAVPPHNDVDIFTQDIGLIAVEENGGFAGFNVAVGGGLGTTHGNADTYPRLGTVIGYIPKDKTLETCWQIAAVQRDFGNREDRKLSRMKYTIDRMGVDAFKAELEQRLGFPLEEARDYQFTHRGDMYDWVQDADGLWHLVLYVEHGRVRDVEGYPIRTALEALCRFGAEHSRLGLRFTPNQNVMLTHISPADKASVERILAEHSIRSTHYSQREKDALACVAMPTCPLALAEAQRYLPSLVKQVDGLLAKYGLENEPVSIRMTGCPNGCARPYVAEIGMIGTSAGHYNLHLGGDALGLRLNRIHHEKQDEASILSVLDGLFAQFAQHKQPQESFGDFVHRTQP